MTRSLLLYAQAPVYRAQDGTLLVERQAINGMIRWAENFEGVVVMSPEGVGDPPTGWVAWTPRHDIRIELFPPAYRPDQFLGCLVKQYRRISGLIDEADYLVFAIGGLWGDWGAVGCIAAHAKGRGYAVWTDRVESDVTRREAAESSGRARLRARLYAGPMAALERHTISRADVGLFHGAECYDFYSPFAKVSELTHDIHVTGDDRISEAALSEKRGNLEGRPLHVGYAGRMHWSKGWEDWLEILAGLRAENAPVTATWLGNGPDEEAFRAAVARLDLEEAVALPGFVEDRDSLLAQVRGFDVLLFCHKTKESPRNLIEALMCGTPIVGYADSYSEDLISVAGGGRLGEPGDTRGLVSTLAALAKDRGDLSGLIANAARDGARFDTQSVFRERSEAVLAHVRPRDASRAGSHAA